MREKIRFAFPFKYIFIALLFCIVYLGIKDTLCDVWILKADGQEYARVWIDGINDKTLRDFDPNNINVFDKEGESHDLYNLSLQLNDNFINLQDTNTIIANINALIDYAYGNSEKASDIKKIVSESKIHVYNCSVEWIDDATIPYWTITEEIQTSDSYSSDWKEKDGYKTLEEMTNAKGIADIFYNAPYKGSFNGNTEEVIKKLDAYTESMMKDFRTYAINLQKSKGMSNHEDIKKRITEFCTQCGFSKEICYGLIDYALRHDEVPVKQRILNFDYSGYEWNEEYYSGKKPVVYSDSHKVFYFFVDKFYQYDVKCLSDPINGLSMDDLESYYVGIVGNINTEYIKEDASSLGFGIGRTFLKVLSSATDELAESVVQNLARDVCWGIIELIETADEAITDFAPTLEKYLDYFGGVGTSKESDVKELFDLNNLFYYLGAFLLVLLTVIQLVTIIVNPDEAKTDIPHLIARFIVLAIFIYWGRYIIDFVFNLTNTIWEWCTSPAHGINLADRNDDRKIFYKAINLVTYDYFGINWTYSVVGVIFNCAIGFIIIKNVFMVLAECIERYIVAVLLYFTFPTALSFGVSNTTSNILVSYFRMLGTQLFMLFMNLYFIKGFVILLNNQKEWANSFYGLIFVIAYLKVAQAFDSYLSSLGLSVAHTSGRMASELLGVGSTLLAGTMMLGRIGMSVGRGLVNVGARGTGNVLATGAILSGSQNKGALKAFNLGENLRTQGLRGLMGGTRLTAETTSRLNTAQTGLFGLSRPENFRSAMSGNISGNILNANRKTNAQALMTALGAGVTANGGIKNARFNALGGGATYSSSVTSANGRVLSSNGQLALSDSQLRLGAGASGARTFGISQSGDVVRGTIGYNTGARGGDSFKLNQGAINKVGNEYCVTNAEIGLGADFLANDKVRANTLDLANQGIDLTLTKQDNGRIMVSRDDTGATLGFMSENGDKWYEAGIRGGSYSIKDLNSGSLAYAKPTETSEAIQITTLSGIASGNVQMTPDFMEKVGKYTNSRGESSNYFEEINRLKSELEEATSNYEAVATSYLDALHTEGTDERERFINNLLIDDEEVKASVPEEWRDVITREDAISMIPDSIEKLEAKQTDNEKDFWSRCIDNSSDYVYMLEYRDQCAEIYNAENAEYKAFCDKYDFDEEATVAVYMDRDDNTTMYATEIHPVTEKESDSIKTEYTVTPLDIDSYNENDGSSVLKGNESHVHDRDFHKYGNNRKG